MTAPVLLVTGGSRGIGAATALAAARAGYAVAVNYQSNSLAADEVVRSIRDSGGKAMALQADVSREDEVMAMFARVDAKWGPLSALVNNAGVVDVSSRVDAMGVARLSRMLNTPCTGQLCVRPRSGFAYEHAPWRHRRRHRQSVQRRIQNGQPRPVRGLCGLQRGD